MNNYWKDHYQETSRRFHGSQLKQVGKTVNGYEISQTQLRLIVGHIGHILHLGARDSMLDLCCGNGLITRRLAPLVREIVAVDFAGGLIDIAKRQNCLHNIEYLTSNVLRLDNKYFQGRNKILMYEALQHFSVEELSSLLDKLSTLEPNSLVFLGSIPNKEKLGVYYDTPEKMSFYLRSEQEGKPHMGRWWSASEIESLGSARGLKTTILAQLPSLYTAHYRFDVLLEACT